MRYLTMALALLCFTLTLSQEKKKSKTGRISFEASIPSFEEVKGTNDKVYCVLNTKTGDFTSIALINDFTFKLPLMKTHFNENYMESHRYPRATFKGKIDGFNWNVVGSELKPFKLKGKLEIHGKIKEINTIALLRRLENTLEISSEFEVNTDDFDVSIPLIVRSKIAKIVFIKTLFLVNN